MSSQEHLNHRIHHGTVVFDHHGVDLLSVFSHLIDQLFMLLVHQRLHKRHLFIDNRFDDHDRFQEILRGNNGGITAATQLLRKHLIWGLRSQNQLSFVCT